MKYFAFFIGLVLVFFAGSFISDFRLCGLACDRKLVSVPPVVFDQNLRSAKSAVLLDVRTGQEFASGHISGAVNADFYQTDQFNKYLNLLDKHRPYFIYCRTGGRSGKTLELMRSKGFSRVTDLSGGIQAWYSAGLPVTR